MDTRNTERRAYKTLRRLAPQCRFTCFAGQLVRARRYMELASDVSIRTLMSRLYGELTRHRSYGILLRIGEVDDAKTR